MRLLTPSKTYAVPAGLCVILAIVPGFLLQAQTPDPPQYPSVKISSETASRKRIPREQALTTAALDGTVREQVSPSASRPAVAVRLSVRNTQTNQTISAVASGDGVFRIFPLPPVPTNFALKRTIAPHS